MSKRTRARGGCMPAFSRSRSVNPFVRATNDLRRTMRLPQTPLGRCCDSMHAAAHAAQHVCTCAVSSRPTLCQCCGSTEHAAMWRPNRTIRQSGLRANGGRRCAALATAGTRSNRSSSRLRNDVNGTMCATMHIGAESRDDNTRLVGQRHRFLRRLVLGTRTASNKSRGMLGSCRCRHCLGY